MLFYIYYHRDLIVNLRLTYSIGAGENLTIDRTAHYYPFGLEFGGELSTSNSITPNYRYSSQGQENQRETRWSSYRWRNYDAAMGRFFNVDPLAEKYPTWSTYAFSGNRVVDARELEGLEPHILFNKREDAAANFGQQYNGKSILNKREYMAFIYSMSVDGKKYYAYNTPAKGNEHGVPKCKINTWLPEGATASAYIHSHGNDNKEYDDENFSGEVGEPGGDIGYANKIKLDAFLVTPGGLLKYFDQSSGTEKTLRKNMPSDPSSLERQNKIDPVKNPSPSDGDYLTKPKTSTFQKPKLDGALKSLDENKKNEIVLKNNLKPKNQ